MSQCWKTGNNNNVRNVTKMLEDNYLMDASAGSVLNNEKNDDEKVPA